MTAPTLEAPRPPTIWELTAEHLRLDEPTDTIGSPVLEVAVAETYVPVGPEVFGAWTGIRRINGEEFHGPVHHIGTTIPYTGARTCPCSTCQSTVAPQLRYD